MPNEPTTPELANIKRACAAFNRHDWTIFFDEVGRDFEFAPAEENVTYRGRELVIEYVERWLRQRGRSKTTGLAVEMLLAQIFTVRDGQQTRMEMYADPGEALKAVGVEQ